MRWRKARRPTLAQTDRFLCSQIGNPNLKAANCPGDDGSAHYRNRSSGSARRFRGFTCLFVFAILLVAGPTGLAASESSNQHALKAAFLYNFTKFINWPTLDAEAQSKYIRMCIHGDNPFGAILASAITGRKVRGREIQVRAVGIDDVVSCDLLFISSSAKKNLNTIFGMLPETGVLTVGDFSSFMAAGGGIELIVAQGEKVKFRINLPPMNRSGFTVDARLLSLAAQVIKDPEEAR